MPVDDRTLAQIALSRAEYDRLVAMLEREPTEVELGMTSALWSEHCGYKHSKPLFRHFPTTGPRVLTEAGAENAGAIDLGEKPIAMETGLRFAVREGGRTVGSGVVTEIIA